MVSGWRTDPRPTAGLRPVPRSHGMPRARSAGPGLLPVEAQGNETVGRERLPPLQSRPSSWPAWAPHRTVSPAHRSGRRGSRRHKGHQTSSRSRLPLSRRPGRRRARKVWPRRDCGRASTGVQPLLAKALVIQPAGEHLMAQLHLAQFLKRKRGERVRPRGSAGVEQDPGVGGQIRGVLCRCLCELPELASRGHGELWSCHETRQPRLASRRECDYGPPEVVGPGCYLSSSFNSSAFAGRHPGTASRAWPGLVSTGRLTYSGVAYSAGPADARRWCDRGSRRGRSPARAGAADRAFRRPALETRTLCGSCW